SCDYPHHPASHPHLLATYRRIMMSLRSALLYGSALRCLARKLPTKRATAASSAVLVTPFECRGRGARISEMEAPRADQPRCGKGPRRQRRERLGGVQPAALVGGGRLLRRPLIRAAAAGGAHRRFLLYRC